MHQIKCKHLPTLTRITHAIFWLCRPRGTASKKAKTKDTEVAMWPTLLWLCSLTHPSKRGSAQGHARPVHPWMAKVRLLQSWKALRDHSFRASIMCVYACVLLCTPSNHDLSSLCMHGCSVQHRLIVLQCLFCGALVEQAYLVCVCVCAGGERELSEGPPSNESGRTLMGEQGRKPRRSHTQGK